MSFEDAARRRDFTVNAIMKDPLTGEIVDPFTAAKISREKSFVTSPSETFAEDSLRVLRAAQFAARFEFDIAPETVELCSSIDVTDLPKERIWGEMEKLLLQAEKPSIGLKWLYDLGVVDQIFPELKTLVGVPQEPEWHPEGNVDVHTMMVADEARKLIDDLPYAKKSCRHARRASRTILESRRQHSFLTADGDRTRTTKPASSRRSHFWTRSAFTR